MEADSRERETTTLEGRMKQKVDRFITAKAFGATIIWVDTKILAHTEISNPTSQMRFTPAGDTEGRR